MRRLLIYIVFTCSISSLIPLGASGQILGSGSRGETGPSAQCSVRWGQPAVFGTGTGASIAVNGPSGLFIEVNAQPKVRGNDLVYRLGRIQSSYAAPTFSAPVAFGEGNNTGVSMNTDGLLIEVHEDAPPLGVIGTQLYYRIGKINLGGGENQKVEWSSPIYSFDGGKDPQVAMNDLYKVVEVHESNNITNHKLYYHTGYIHQTGDKYYITWNSGGPNYGGIPYDEGRNPHVTIDNEGNIIEVHQASSSNNLHYRRGHLNGLGIDWEPAAPNGRYETGRAERPAVAMRNDGFVLEVHGRNDSAKPIDITGKYGQVNPRSRNVVDWSDGGWTWGSAKNANVSMDGSKAIAVFAEPGGFNLKYSAGDVNCR